MQTFVEFEVPEAGSTTNKVFLALVDPDGAPAGCNIELQHSRAENNAGTDRSSNLSSVTVEETGLYSLTYTVTAGDSVEGLIIAFSATMSDSTLTGRILTQVVDLAGATKFLTTDRTAIIDAKEAAEATESKLPSKPYIAGSSDADGGIDPTELAVINGTVDQALEDYDSPTKAEMDTQHSTTQAAIAGISAGSAPTLLQTATIGTLNSQTSFTLSAGSADDSAYSKQLAIIVDQSTSTQKTVCNISAYTGATKTVTLNESPKFTVAAGDTVYVVAASKTTLDDDTINSLTGTLVTFSAPTFTSGGWDRDFIKGDSYTATDAMNITVENWGGAQLISAASEIKLSGSRSVDGTTTSFEWDITPGNVTVNGTTTTIPIVLTTTDTNVTAGEYTADLRATWTSPAETKSIIQPKFKLRIVEPESTF